MACEAICDHCHGTVDYGHCVTRGANSYHDACHKCYVCSETDLRDCEVFKGVIFCRSCSQRIFYGCASARMSKSPTTRTKRSSISTCSQLLYKHGTSANMTKPRSRLRSNYSSSEDSIFEERLSAKTVKRPLSKRSNTSSTPVINGRSSTKTAKKRGLIEVTRPYGSSSQHILDECSGGAKMTKSRPKRSCSRPPQVLRKSSRHRHRSKVTDRHKPRLQPRERGVIETARLALSNGTDTEDDLRKDSFIKPKREIDVQVIKQTVKASEEPNLKNKSSSFAKNSFDTGTATNVTQEILQQMKCPVIEWSVVEKPRKLPEQLSDSKHTRSPKHEGKRNHSFSSDMRLAEFGVSTEIANMALIKDKPRSKPKESTNLGSSGYTDATSNEEKKNWESLTEVELEEEVEFRISPANILDNVFDILTMPFRYFKKNILRRSSLISVIIGEARCKNCTPFQRRLRSLFYDECVAHRRRGIKRLHSTIVRRRKPYKMGWLHVEKDRWRFNLEKNSNQCKHIEDSCSYRCLRHYVMKRAGPTKSELNMFWIRLFDMILPEFIKRCLTTNFSPMVRSAACSQSQSASTQILLHRKSLVSGSNKSYSKIF